MKTVKRNNKIYKHSLNRQMTVEFAVILAFTIIAVLLFNIFFLEKFYINNKKAAMLDVYSNIESSIAKGDSYGDDFDLQMRRYAGKHNISIAIINSDFQMVRVYSNEPTADILTELRENLLGINYAPNVMDIKDNYVMTMKPDRKTGIEYIEMWGVLQNGSFFMMRTALESITESSKIANRFLLYVGIIGTVVGAVLIYFLSKKISKPVLELSDISEQIADMNFEVEYNGKEKNEIGLLGNNINRLSKSLEQTITELKVANLELEKDNELKTQVDEMRKDFISNVSHELKTPIALIQGYAEGLKEGVSTTEDRDYYCDVIMDEAARMNIMVKKLLALNQLEFGGYSPVPERFDVVSVIGNYIQSADILIKQNNISVSLPNSSVYVWADEFMIEEVLSNYISNAINHNESELEKRIDVSLQMFENKVRVSVFNTGKPIPEDAIDHLWEKFYKVDKARTRSYGGSGIGLSIVKAIMEAHNQNYGVENREDGVVFWFEVDKA